MRYTFFFLLAVAFPFFGKAQHRVAGRPSPLPGASLFRQTRDSIALDSLRGQVAYWRAHPQKGQLFAALRRYASQCYKMDRYNLFLQSAREMAAIARSEKDSLQEAVSLVNMGIALLNKNQLDSASYYQYKALHLAMVLQHDSLIAENYACLSSIYNYRKEYRKSVQFSEKALVHAERWKGSGELMVVCLACKAIAYGRLQQYAAAIEADLKALPLAQALGNADYLVTIKMNLARNYVYLENYSAARRYLKELERDLPQSELSPFYFTTNMAILAMTYGDLREYGKAVPLLLQLLPAARALNHVDLLQRMYEKLSVMAEAEQRYKDALAYHKAALYYQAVVQKQNNDQLFSELEVRYQSAEKERVLTLRGLQLARKDLQLQKNRYYMYYTLAGLVVALLLTALLLLHARYKRREHRRALHDLQQQRELQLLQALMQGEEKERSRIAKDLHDGVAGMLAAVQMHLSSLPAADYLLQEEGYRQGMHLLHEAMGEIRKTSHHLMPEVLLQHGLDEALRRYCVGVSNSRRLLIQYDSWGEIPRYPGSFELSVYRIVQELVHNILKHSGATQAIVQVSQQQGVLSLSIEDNGSGFVSGQQGDGTGLRSLHHRVQAMNGKLEVLSTEQSGVSAYLEFETAGLERERAPDGNAERTPWQEGCKDSAH